ncbi:hypothetical protein [Micromonospora sp. KC721]|uniref:hypothetical protein n=1 Tax=Micromonospora sp. KC721 TaxID=2530380 RepID=UPI00104D2F61|nr:hypothetical protein [Micromonospora sp. KC721]TDB80160.1 hypothetical protein E1182_09980 [Micromonospora sp. KC721]
MPRIASNRALTGLAIGLLTATLGAPGVATAASRPVGARLCALKPLPLPTDVTHGEAEVIDPTGRFIAGRGVRITGDVWESLLLLWDGPRVSVVPTDAGEQVSGVNRNGVVIGSIFVGGSYRPWRYRDGRLEELLVPASVSGAWAEGINARGDIVGRGAVEATETMLPLLWPADRPGTVEVIDAPRDAIPMEILDDGTVVGNAGGSGGSPPALAWVRRTDGRIDRLTRPTGEYSWVTAAAGDWAVGGVGPGPDGEGYTPTRWDLRSGIDVPTNPGLSTVRDINARGIVLGVKAVDHGDRLVPLPGAVPGTVSVWGMEIADNGTVVGYLSTDRLRPVRWIGC